jgi:hypothetical protein
MQQKCIFFIQEYSIVQDLMAALKDGHLQLLLIVSGDYNVKMNAQASAMLRILSHVQLHPVVGLSL